MAKDRSGGPRKPEPEKVPRSNKHITIKKGQELKCMGCTNGKVLGPKGKLRTCGGCKGTGFITA